MDDENYKRDAEELLGRLALLDDWRRARRLTGANERAFVIEFAGMPKAGKSSAIETIRHFFSHGPKIAVRALPNYPGAPGGKSQRVHTPAEGVSLRTPNTLKPNLFDFNSWAGAYGLQELLQATHDHDHDVVLLDRGPWDAGCWLEYVRTHRKSDLHVSEHAKDVVAFFQLPYWTTLADLHVPLVVDPGEAAERERVQRLIEHGGAASDPDLMAAMRKIYDERFESLQSTKAKHCKHVGLNGALRIDTTDKAKNPKAVAIEVLGRAFDVLKLKTAHRTGDSWLTEKRVKSVLAAYTKKMRSSQRTELFGYLPSFVAAVNGHGTDRRRRIAASLLDYELPKGVELLNSTPTSQSEVVSNLRRLLDRPESRT